MRATEQMQQMTLDVRPNGGGAATFSASARSTGGFWPPARQAAHDFLLHKTPGRTILVSKRPGIQGMSGHCSLQHQSPP
jgi:hypothetical protein